MKAWAVVPAAGAGRRFSTKQHKQFLTLNDQFIFAIAVQTILECPQVEGVVVALQEISGPSSVAHEHWLQLQQRYHDRLLVTHGGTERIWSVQLGLQALAQHPRWSVAPDDMVLVHDGARPCLHPQDLVRIIEQYQLKHRQQMHNSQDYSTFGILLGRPVTDTIKQVIQQEKQQEIQDTIVHAHVDRSSLWQAQTPQAFQVQALMQCLEDFKQQAQSQVITDESQIMAQAGVTIHTLQAQHPNPKLTYTDDWPFISCLLQDRASAPNKSTNQEKVNMRIGQGFDVHQFSNEPPIGGFIMLAGVRVPSKVSLVAHSDGDVVLHAVCDALLGAAALGDIGEHFSDQDDTFKDKNSAWFVEQTMQLLQQQNYRVINIDITVIAQVPKINPHRQAMNACIASLLNIEQTCVNVKATTTEHLGFAGRKEGIAAQAVVLVSRSSVVQ